MRSDWCVVVEAAIGQQHLMQRVFASVAKGGVPEIMDERHAFGEILVELQRTCQSSGDLCHLDRMRQARAVMIAILRDEDLCLMLQPPESGRMHDAVAVALEIGARRARSLLVEPSTRFPGIGRINSPLTITETQCMPVDRHYPSIPALERRAFD